jgi:hypothetical protein
MTMTRTHFSFRVDTWTADGAGAAQTSVFVTVKSCVAIQTTWRCFDAENHGSPQIGARGGMGA